MLPLILLQSEYTFTKRDSIATLSIVKFRSFYIFSVQIWKIILLQNVIFCRNTFKGNLLEVARAIDPNISKIAALVEGCYNKILLPYKVMNV